MLSFKPTFSTLEELQTSEKRKEAKGKEKSIHIHLNAEFQRTARRNERQAGIKSFARRNIITSDMQMIPPLRQKEKRNSKAS